LVFYRKTAAVYQKKQKIVSFEKISRKIHIVKGFLSHFINYSLIY